MPLACTDYYNKKKLILGSIDKTVFFVAKIPQAELFKEKFNLTEIYSKNGFVFLKREPK
jgi:hypothetical protein